MILPSLPGLTDFIKIRYPFILGIFFLYAEIHFKLPLLRGFLYKKRPEILFDVPHRVESGTLPVLLLIKDSHRFPVFIHKVEIQINERVHSFNIGKKIESDWWYKVFKIDARDYTDSEITVTGRVYVKKGKKQKIITNDNLPTLPHADFTCFVDSEKLPVPEDWMTGDLHCHSSFTEDQIEFGAPPAVIPSIAQHMGLSFCGLLEHAYDLDDLAGSWVKEDPQLHKWQKYIDEVELVNQENPEFILLHGEEVSVNNGYGKNVHMGILNCRIFFKGTGDSMENKLGRKPDFHFSQVADQVPDTALCFAAHPQATSPKVHEIFIKRGKWDTLSYYKTLKGLQIANGEGGDGLDSGKTVWINHLLRGRKQLIYAGNDAHGSFNRFQAVLLPMLKIFEKKQQVFGQHMTIVKSQRNISKNKFISCLKTNPSIISSGPFCNLNYINSHDEIREINDTITDQNGLIKIHAESTKYFGKIIKIHLFCGDVKKQEEIQVFKTKPQNTYRFETTLKGISLPQSGYCRLEILTDHQKFAFTNPIWIDLTT